ncbi:maleylpyruvate isomerase N-terminal domain-containing protein [Streptomyces sp. Y2F8-2]|uniref:maleylpyruvate isomerase N-terminal domain-containing protein n=1 Tax=Streptomyces sp. Y2F8-2 TaxID=2759675 RepID=UPI0027E46EEB|nr:maleylpyruvate isomerase N-terminal domain-containing protein [Streptomyces sp. Y2F8-2]
MLRLIDERSAAFRAAVASAPSLDVQVPTCPEWTLFDLVRHLEPGAPLLGRHRGGGPADAPLAEATAERAMAAPRGREALLAWSAASTQQLLDVLREAGPDQGCWTWWGASQSPQTCGAVARHQLQEVAVHTYDALITLGAAQALRTGWHSTVSTSSCPPASRRPAPGPTSPLPSSSTPPRAAAPGA